MYTLNISSTPLAPEERLYYHSHLLEMGIEDSIWDVYDKFLEIQTEYSKPIIIRIYRNNEELACLFLIQCKDYGATLSGLCVVKRFVRLLSIPVAVWMKAGIAAEICANPAFFNMEIRQENDMVPLTGISLQHIMLMKT